MATVVLAAAATTAGCGGPAGPVVVTEARVRALIPGQDKTAAYFTVRNTTGDEVTITGAGSPAARAVEMHTTRREGNVMRMRRLPEVVVPAGKTVRFEPGGRHLMLFGVTELNESIEIVLDVEDRDAVRVQFQRIPIGDG